MDTKEPLIDKIISYALLGLGSALGLAAIISLFSGGKTAIDQNVLLSFVVAASILWLKRVKEINFGGNSVKFQELEQLKKDVNQVQSGLDTVVSTQEDRSKARALTTQELVATTLVKTAKSAAPKTQSEFQILQGIPMEKGTAYDDPWKGVFGGNAVSNGRKLSATVKRLTPRSSYFNVKLKVVSTDGSKPLAGYVRFFLHDSIDPDQPIIKVAKGAATYQVMVYGAFTVGVLADRGATKLELDLSELPDVDEDFKDN